MGALQTLADDAGCKTRIDRGRARPLAEMIDKRKNRIGWTDLDALPASPAGFAEQSFSDRPGRPQNLALRRRVHPVGEVFGQRVEYARRGVAEEVAPLKAIFGIVHDGGYRNLSIAKALTEAN